MARPLPQAMREALARGGVRPELLAGARRNPRAASSSDPERLNGWELEYARELSLRLYAGLVVLWRPQPFSLRLAHRTHYRPDFLVVLADGTTEVVDVKGHSEDDARAKIKIAAALYPCWLFVQVTRERGVFVREEIARP